MNPVALVTGASRGIGRGIAIELASAGYDVVINYTANEQAATHAKVFSIATAHKADRNVRVDTCRADIADPKERQTLIDFTRERFGRIDLLVNNAGIAPKTRADILEAGEASFDHLIAVNLKGPYFLTQAVAQWMIDAVQEGQYPDGLPKIVTISSISAYTASVNRGDYCISKAGLSMMTKLFAARLVEYGIRVYEIRPGLIATDMTGPVKAKYDKMIADGLTPIARWGQPADIGRAVVALAQNLFPFSTGEVINVDGGFHLRIL